MVRGRGPLVGRHVGAGEPGQKRVRGGWGGCPPWRRNGRRGSWRRDVSDDAMTTDRVPPRAQLARQLSAARLCCPQNSPSQWCSRGGQRGWPCRRTFLGDVVRNRLFLAHGQDGGLCRHEGAGRHRKQDAYMTAVCSAVCRDENGWSRSVGPRPPLLQTAGKSTARALSAISCPRSSVGGARHFNYNFENCTMADVANGILIASACVSKAGMLLSNTCPEPYPMHVCHVESTVAGGRWRIRVSSTSAHARASARTSPFPQSASRVSALFSFPPRHVRPFGTSTRFQS